MVMELDVQVDFLSTLLHFLTLARPLLSLNSQTRYNSHMFPYVLLPIMIVYISWRIYALFFLFVYNTLPSSYTDISLLMSPSATS